MVLTTDPRPGPMASSEARNVSGTRPSAPDVRRSDIQGLRAIAVLLVVGYHAGMPLPGGFVGVDIFFVISGFVITGMLHREWEAHGRIRYGRFYLRRIKRLTPALALMVSVTVLLSAHFLSPLGPQQSTAQTAVGAMFIVANAVIARTTGNYFDGPAESNALLHTWSLSVEEQFYLVFPVLLAVSWMLARRSGWSARRVSSVVVAVVAVFSFTVAVAVSRGFEVQAGEMLVGFYGPLTRVWEFAVGALLALVPVMSRAVSRRADIVKAGGLLLVLSVVFISGDTPFPGPWTLLPVLGTVLFIWSGGRSDHTVSRLLRSAPMVKVGDWSYSIYLWHWPFIVFAGALWPHEPGAVALAALLSFLPALASYRWVEEPIRYMEFSGARGVGRLVALSVVPSAALAGILFIAVDRGFWSSTVRAHQAAVLDAHAGCIDLPLRSDTARECTFNGSADGDPVYLLGDSNAQHFSEGVIAAAKTVKRPVLVSTTSACPFLDLRIEEVDATARQMDTCSARLEAARSYMASAPVGTVILAAADVYWTDSRFALVDATGTAVRNSGAKLREATIALESTIRALQGAGHEVFVVQSIPRWTGSDDWSPAECTWLSVRFGLGSCEKRMRIETVEQRQGAVRAAVDQAAQFTGAEVLDPRDSLCSDEWCSTHADGVTVYRDASHISVAKSEAMARDFCGALARRGPS